MLLHEWMKYRDRRIRRPSSTQQAPQAPETQLPEPAAAEQTESSTADAQTLTSTDAPQPSLLEAEGQRTKEAVAAERAVDAIEEEVLQAEEAKQPDKTESVAEKSPADSGEEQLPSAAASRPSGTRRQQRQPRGPRTAEEVLASLEAPASTRERLRALIARQQSLPLDVEVPQEPPKPRRGRRKVVETREQLVARLLDPVLTLQETALLLDVCPTTVRRYTNKGVLRCFRTPGNQRRFRLADVLDFLERREQGEV